MTQPVPDNIISVRELSKVYLMGTDSLHALRSVSLNIQRGSYVAIMGPSGSGKTTFLDILGCLSRPTSGEYWFMGRKVSEYSEIQLARIRNQEIGFVFQNF
ncbi:MAG TPA: ATP-binding cassette domain-containing protein, partial [Candidatus Hydrogenedentes bacterium]|nr:ATP-binding cassette domain-containing protein [Candidatus Hydrogenedentota bacterium]